MPDSSACDDPTMPPPGRRTGRGAQSVLPYLAKSLAAKPQSSDHGDTQPRTVPVPRNAGRGDDGWDSVDVPL